MRKDIKTLVYDEELHLEAYRFEGIDYARFERSLCEALGKQADILLVFALDFIRLHKEDYFTA